MTLRGFHGVPLCSSPNAINTNTQINLLICICFRRSWSPPLKVCTVPTTEGQRGRSQPELPSQVPPELSGDLEYPAPLHLLHPVQKPGCDCRVWTRRGHRPVPGKSNNNITVTFTVKITVTYSHIYSYSHLIKTD
jgi:hypothetical protein